MRATGRRSVVAALLCAAALGATACEDPILIIGDLPGTMRRVAGIPNRAGPAVDSLATQSQLFTPRGLAVAADGTLYIADSRNARIVAVTPTGRASVVASAVSCTDACLVEPHGVALAGDGSLWIADPGAHRLFRLDLDTQHLEVRAGTGVAGASPEGTQALEADLNRPTGIAVSANGVVYFSERGGHRILWIQSQGGLRILAGTGEAGFSDDSPATNARLNGPAGLFISGTTLYFADLQNDRVRAVALNGGSIRTVAGNGVAGYSESDSIAPSAKLNSPIAVVVTHDGTQLFIADEDNHRVRVVNLATRRISSFAGTGNPAFTGERLDATDTGLDLPSGLGVHPGGELFISVAGHQIVWRTALRF
ncbi:MAG TPA: hypothetical protein VMN78_11650 [Longimicrobiales bacterium]|nr:hypothetical protein [Longimicrobiales bacterium]